ncbi:MAG: DUF805 domain-containing protein [Bacteroidaceae bacterium]|nr:DUF805 domain-containing protein [Bacteroidaceae bacterium]
MFRKTFTISGRSRRSEFFPYMVMLPPFALLLCGFLPVVGAIVFLILWIAPVVRRLHDIGRCGWWCLHPMSFFWFFKDSDPGTNDYGPSPKYQPEAFSHKPADKSREIALAWLAFLGVVLFITLIVIAVTFIR